MIYTVIHKPTFTNQLLALHPTVISQVLDKARLLETAPAPDAKSKKRLVGYRQPIFRLRAGDYRILYTFDERAGWVALLGVDDRKDVYREGELVTDITGFAAPPDLGDALEPVASLIGMPATKKFDLPDTGTPLERVPDATLLERARIPAEYHDPILACRTVEDLCAAPIPEAMRERVFDASTTPDYDRVVSQPSYVTGEMDDLLRYANGELLGFLLQLNAEQEKYVEWALNAGGPTLVKGGPGTGKSTVALYRARAMLRTLRSTGVAQPRILFTTYTNALVNFSRQLLSRLLGEDASCVEVRTADSLIRDVYVAAVGSAPIFADTTQQRVAVAEAMDTAVWEGNALQRRAQQQAIARLSADYLLEEFNTLIEGRALASLEEYRATPRAGRCVPLNALQRGSVWRVYEGWRAALARRGVTTWSQGRRVAMEAVNSGKVRWEPYDGVIVDEAQDVDPTVLRLLVTVCRAPNRFFVTADANQSIYGGSFRWSDVHADLRFTGRTGILRLNHRSTREIGEATHAYLREGVLDEDEPVRTYVQIGGPQPVVRAVNTAYDETELLRRFLPLAARDARLGVGACAVLAPTEEIAKGVAARLTDAGVDATAMTGRTLDLAHPAVKVLTLRAAKGLEFPAVALAGFVDGIVPSAGRETDLDARAEVFARERRTLYVAMTRAMRALLIVVPAGHPSPLFAPFDPALWNTQRAAGNGGAPV